MEAIFPHAVKSLGRLQSHRDGLTHLVHQSHGAQLLGPLTCPVSGCGVLKHEERKGARGTSRRQERSPGGRPMSDAKY